MLDSACNTDALYAIYLLSPLNSIVISTQMLLYHMIVHTISPIYEGNTNEACAIYRIYALLLVHSIAIQCK